MKLIYKHKIQYYETDQMKITHHSNYVRFMEESRTAFMEAIGYPYQALEKENMISPVVAISLQYKKPTLFGSTVEIEVSVKEFSAVKFTFDYVMRCEGEIVCTASSTHCFVNENGRPISVKKQKPDFYEKITSVVNDDTLVEN